MIIDGKKLAESMYEELRLEVSSRTRPPRLSIIACAPNFETQKYLALKQKKASQVGIETQVIELSPTSTTEDFLKAIEPELAKSNGVIVQLPLPQHVDTERVLTAVPESHDVDALSPNTTRVLSPVVGAIKHILDVNDILPEGKHVTIIGSGRLVGIPAHRWFASQGASVSVVTKDTPDISYYTRPADIVVCGAGVPGLLTGDMIKDGVIIFDAGTSEDGGVLRGDADPACAEKAFIFTPVPGGIGPMTIAVLLKNLVVLTQEE